MNKLAKAHNGNKLPISKEELIEKMNGFAVKCESQEDIDECYAKIDSLGFTHHNTSFKEYQYIYMYCKISLRWCGCHELCSIPAREFLSWFEEEPTSTPPKKRGRKPKVKPLNKREKWEARIESFEKEKKEALSCSYDGREIAVYVNGEYSTNSTCSPEEALVFAKWIINLEGE